MLMYMFTPDNDGDAVRNALTEAARRGVDVKLLIDGFGSAATPKFFTELAEAGGEYCVFNPSYGRRYLLRNHQKLIVIDEATVLIGGANIDATYLDDRSAEALARPVASPRRPRGRASSPLFRQPVPLVEAAEIEASIAQADGRGI